jgi:hypothetical protein
MTYLIANSTHKIFAQAMRCTKAGEMSLSVMKDCSSRTTNLFTRSHKGHAGRAAIGRKTAPQRTRGHRLGRALAVTLTQFTQKTPGETDSRRTVLTPRTDAIVSRMQGSWLRGVVSPRPGHQEMVCC